MTQVKNVVTLMDLLENNSMEGKKAKIITENELYGTTVVRVDKYLYNDRNKQVLPISSDLINSKFKLIDIEKEISLDEFIRAYNKGQKIKIEIEDKYRFIQKESEEEQSPLSSIFSMFEIEAVSNTEFISMKELTNGKFYIVDDRQD